MGKKGLTDEQWQKIAEDIMETRYEETREKIDPKKSAMPMIKQRAKEMGFPEDCHLKNVCFENPSMFKEVLMEAYKKTPYNVEKSFIIKAISSPQNKDLTEFFIEEIYKTNNKLMLSSLGNAISRVSSKEHIEKYIKLMYDYKDYPNILFFASSCFYKTADKKYIEKYLEMLNDEDLGRGRIRAIQVLGKLKVKEAISKIIELLEDSDFRETGLDALNRFKDSKFLPYFEKYLEDEDRFVRISARGGIRTIEKMKNS